MWNYVYSNELMHYGIKGQKWGVRRYQNEDGSLTNAGRKRVLKTVKKYSNKKDRRARLGQAVGEDELITEAARKVIPSAKKSKEATVRRSVLERKMQKEERDIRDRLDWERPDLTVGNQVAAQMKIDDKYGKKYNKLREQEKSAHTEYKENIKRVVDEYLGKYGDKYINSGIFDTRITAGEALATQIDWGIMTGRINE